MFFLLLILSAVTAWPGPAKAPPEPRESIIAIADVHNDFDDFVVILRRTGLIDQQNHWIGGKTTFVQVGDLLDRGPKPREVMNLMMALEKESAQAGGRVVGLLGNHEVMHIMGDLRYVTPQLRQFRRQQFREPSEGCVRRVREMEKQPRIGVGRTSAPHGIDRGRVDGAPSSRLRRAARGIWSKGRIRSLVAGTFRRGRGGRNHLLARRNSSGSRQNEN